MESRLSLHEKLVSLLGSENVYFQPPPTVQMQYPCIVYQRDSGDTTFGDNYPYTFVQRYKVIAIDRNPDSLVPYRIARAFQMCIYDRHYTADNLNHDTFNLYY